MARTINMHTEHISTWYMHEYFSKGTAVLQIEFSGKNFLHPKLVKYYFKYFQKVHLNLPLIDLFNLFLVNFPFYL